MSGGRTAACAAACLILCSCVLAVEPPYDASAADADGPLFVADAAGLAELRVRYLASDPEVVPAVDALLALADTALSQGPWSVMDKAHVPPSGNKHDYMSLAIYWWPNGITADGLPYVLRDGEVNPEFAEYDYPRLEAMCTAAEILSLAYFYSGNAAYADRCAHILRVWFLDPATRMNPGLAFTQCVPGLSSANSFGVLEGEGFSRRLIDAIGLICGSGSLAPAELDALKGWFSVFLHWLRTSTLGRDASIHTNNHGTFYWMQVMVLSMYTGDVDLAHSAAGQAAYLLDRQIRPDGAQPEELTRTKSFYYSEYNLTAWFALARAAEHLGYDFWSYEPRPGRGIGSALTYLADYLPDCAGWPFQNLGGVDMDSLYPYLRVAAEKIDSAFDAYIDRLPSGRAGHAADLVNIQG